LDWRPDDSEEKKTQASYEASHATRPAHNKYHEDGSKMSDSALKTLGDFLRARRDAFDSSRLSLPRYGRRRVSGIRREELAMLAGVSTSYYTRIEQGVLVPSPDVLDAIADALQLEPDDRRQLQRLAQATRMTPAPASASSGATTIVPSLERMLRTITHTPAAVLAPDMQLLGWNRICQQVFAPEVPFELPWSQPDAVNWVRFLFLDPSTKRLFKDWAHEAEDLVGRLRAAHAANFDDPRLNALIASMRRDSAEFAGLWDRHPVRESSLGLVELNHPTLGELCFQDSVLRPTDDTSQLLLVFVAEAGSETERKLHALREQETLSR
jgi:transcriptional regulator with XRE-family HTH domain